MPFSRRRGSSEADAAGDLLDLPLAEDSRAVDAEPVVRDASEIEAAVEARRPRRRRRGRRSGWLWLVLVLAFPIGALVGYLLSSDPPVAVVSSDLLDFGEARLGSASERTIRLSNQGEQALWITATVLIGEAAEEYRILADECAGLELAAQGDCAVRLVFRPATRGARGAEVRFDGNAANGAQRVTLIGVGVQAELSIEPAELDLGRQVVGDAGASGDLRLENRGTAALGLGRVELTGRDGADFLRVADDCSSRQLAPGDRCSVRFTFVPRQAGERRATVRIETDGTPEPATAALVAVAAPRRPILRLDPDGLDFGQLRVGETSAARAVKVHNDGNAALRVRRLWIDSTPAGVAAGAFELVADSCSGHDVAPGEHCVIEIRFRPPGEAAVRAVLDIDSSIAETSHRLLLRGLGSAPRLQIEPQRLSFGAVALGAMSPIRELRLRNPGSAALVIGEIAISGSDAGAFAVGGCFGTAIEAGSECVVSLRFQPRRAGPHRADLVIRHDADSRRRQLAINGLGVAPRLSLRPARLGFGEVRLGSEARRRLVVENSGRASLTIQRLRLTGGRSAGFDLAADGCTGVTLRPAATCHVTVRFRPTAAGARSIRLVIESSAGGTPREVPIDGAATARSEGMGRAATP